MAMFHLESLKLTGFKSFPDAVELSFPGRISAIIGPNGCGKSNLVDAILWVLGEQSPSLLRLKHMGDVVFSGAAKRSPSGAAEVTLRLRSEDGRWSETGGRLEIRRRVYRSGPSEYKINGKAARLLDVNDALLSVGLGTRGYSIIEQGRVGQVLSARPTDRRVLLEEAAGITHYKVRRRESELKLERTRQNLLRLEDIINEVDRSLRQLKRQAKQADVYQKFENQLKETLHRLHRLEARMIDILRSDISRTRARLQNEVAAAASALGSVDADLSQARKDEDGARQDVEAVRSEIADLIASRERLEAFLERSNDLLDSMRSTLFKNRRDEAALISGGGELDAKRDEATARFGVLYAEFERVGIRVDEAAAAEAAARQRFEELEKTTGLQRQELLRSISSLTDSRNRLGALDRDQDRLGYALNQNLQELERLELRQSETRERFDIATEAGQRASAEAEKHSATQRLIQNERSQLREESAAAKHDVESLGHQIWELRHRLTGLDRELANHASAVEDISSVLPTNEIRGQISDFLHPDPSDAGDLDRLWGDYLEIPVISGSGLTPEQRHRIAGLENRVRLAFTIAQEPLVWPHLDAGEPMIDVAGVNDQDLRWLTRCLPPAYRCADPGTAAALAAAHPDVRILDENLVLYQGCTVAPPTAGAKVRGALALRAERDKIRKELETLRSRSEQAAGHHEKLALGLADAEHRLTQINQAMLVAEQERARRQAVEQAVGKELARFENEIAAMQGEIRRNRDLGADMARRRSRLAQEVTSLETRSLELEHSVEENTLGVAGLRDHASQTLRELDRLKSEQKLVNERTTAARTETERLEREQQDLAMRLQRLQIEVTDLESELERTETEVVRSRTRLAEEQGQLAASRERERGLGRRGEAISARVAKLEVEVRQRREHHDATRQHLHETEVERTRIDAEWDRIRDATLNDLTIAPEELLKEEPDPEDDVATLKLKAARLRSDLEKIGPVNLLAIKEVSDLGERSVFLKAQRKDLVEALRSIDATIQEIDLICTERFIDTFVQVNTVFTETFSVLFGGGTARLDLVDEDDPLESGIDITAQPPGKKNQSVQLLSGGEKALTALSLLIALFRIKPSPFCVLDEVDAPLDDANVHRLADLVKSMTEHTQFLMVTHNRRTMARADILYGVTMEEPGVSKVVSARLED